MERCEERNIVDDGQRPTCKHQYRAGGKLATNYFADECISRGRDYTEYFNQFVY